MRVLVTGANGFVGEHAVAVLRSRGHTVIAGTLGGEQVADAISCALDVRDTGSIDHAVREHAPEGILHLAAIAFVPAAQKDPQLAFATNAGGTLNLLHAARRTAPACRVILVSTAEVYGPAPPERMPLSEELPMRPATLYGASKASAEHLARAFANEGLDVVILRPFNHIGPGQKEPYVVASFAAQIAALERQGGGVLRHGNLDAQRDFLDVRDVVRGYAMALEAERGRLISGQPYNLCAGQGVTIGSIVKELAARARCEVRTEIDPARLRKVDVPVYIGDPSRFRTALGFAPEIPFARTLDDILGAVRGAT